MQFSIAILFLSAIYAAAAEDTCPPTEVVKFAELYANPHLHPCQKASAGFSMAPPVGYPTEPQVKAMCASDACRALIKDVLELKPADCYLSFAGVKLNVYKMASRLDGACNAATNEKHENGTDKPTLKPTDGAEDYHKPEEPMIIKDDHDDKRCPTHHAGKENAKEAEVKPPMNGAAFELFPMPNTTYKASVPTKA